MYRDTTTGMMYGERVNAYCVKIQDNTGFDSNINNTINMNNNNSKSKNSLFNYVFVISIFAFLAFIFLS